MALHDREIHNTKEIKTNLVKYEIMNDILGLNHELLIMLKLIHVLGTSNLINPFD